MGLAELCEAAGVSGDEGRVRELIGGELRGSTLVRRVDSLGNLFIKRPGDGPRVMVAAHMDEIGLMVTHIEGGGELRFRPVGGIEPAVLLAKVVRVGRDGVPGVIGAKPVHLAREEEQDKPPEMEELFIDVGATSGEEAKKHVRLGDYVAFATAFEELGGAHRAVKGKALDDRVGCYILARLLEEPRATRRVAPTDLTGVFTVQEEVGLRGARVAAAAVEPDLALILEGTVCDDLPGEEERSPVTRMGSGPAITLMDRTFLAHRPWVDLLVGVAEREGIPYQFKAPGLGGTEAGAVHLAGRGIPCAVVAAPVRYIHSPVGIMSLNDLENTLALARAALAEVAARGGL